MFKKDFWVTFLFAFVLAWLLLQLPFFQKPTEEAPVVETPLIVTSLKPSYGLGETVSLTISAGSGVTLAEFDNEYPQEPFTVKRDNKILESNTHLDWNLKGESLTVTQDEPLVITYDPWNKDIFDQPGVYTIEIPYNDEIITENITINADNFFSGTWHLLFNRPIYNLLIYFSLLFGNSLAWGIVVVTILLRLMLLIPSQHALESQKAMQVVQPKLQEIQRKYKGDQQRIAVETAQIMKEHKVNPMGGCLPMLFQIPILLGLFVSIQHGLTIAYSAHLYDPLKTAPIDAINHMFFGINLAEKEMIIIPLTVMILQFIQLQISFKKTKAKSQEAAATGMPDPASMQKYMKIGLPLLIGFMALSLPAGVGLYWAVSTLFGIGQQAIVNREKYTT